MSTVRKTAAELRAELQRKREMTAAQFNSWAEERKMQMAEQEAEFEEEIEKSLGFPREGDIPENQAGASMARGREVSQQQERGPMQQRKMEDVKGRGATSSAESVENGDDDTDGMSVDSDDSESSDSVDELEEGPSKQWSVLQGDARCDACRAKQLNCEVDWKLIAEWRETVELGRVPVRAPAGTGCQRCQSKKHSCKLPATKDLWEASKRKRTAAAAAGLTLNDSEKDKEQRPAKRARLDASHSNDFASEVIERMEAQYNISKKILEILLGIINNQRAKGAIRVQK